MYKHISRFFIGIYLLIFVVIGCSNQGGSFMPQYESTSFPSPTGDFAFSLVEGGKSSYAIVLPQNPSEVDILAASELQTFIEQISGAKLPIKNTSSQEQEIRLGFNYTSDLKSDGFRIKTENQTLYIDGSPIRGILYGVYGFLEDYLGCRWYTADASYIPSMDTIHIAEIDNTQIPIVGYREVLYSHLQDDQLAARLRLNGNVQSGRHPGYGTWCHTFYTYVPPEEYFESNPEYFSRRFFTRSKDSQLCLTNEEVFLKTVDSLREHIENEPTYDFPIWAEQKSTYWDVSQMDNAKPCQCFSCMKLNMKEGTPMGSILPFINRVADEFPDKIISTLAYWYSEEPPKNVKPADNVSIMLCPISIKRDQPLYESSNSKNQKFTKNIQGWSEISDRLFIWDYVIGFNHLLMPFPNFFVQQENIKFFIEHDVKGIFSQGNRDVGGEFAELRAYLLAKLLWNPDANVDEIINDFLGGYYGEAAPFIRQYIDEMQKSMKDSGKELYIFDHPKTHKKGYLSEEMISRYTEILNSAKNAVAGNKTLLARVESISRSTMYVSLVLEYGTKVERRDMLEEFYTICKRDGVTLLHEWDTTPDEFYQEYKSKLE